MFKILNRWKAVIIITASVRFVLFILPPFIKDITNIFYPWVQWDGPHYIDIAKNWYQVSGEQALWIVFYPLYPLLIKVFNFLINDFSVSAVLISIVFSFSASILLYELTLLDFGKRIAILAVWFLNIFPTSYFLQASYTESLFLTTSLATIYFFRKRSFIRSGLSGAFASMTRINGILLLPILIMESKTFSKNLITILLAPVGFLVYIFINYLIFGEPLYFAKALSSNWFKSFTWPWISIKNLFYFFQSQTGDYYWLFLTELITIFLLMIATVLVYIYVRKSYGIYMFFNLLLLTSTSFIMSTPRYILVLFPIFIGLALINNKFILILISLIFLTLLSYFTYLYTQGRWAF